MTENFKDIFLPVMKGPGWGGDPGRADAAAAPPALWDPLPALRASPVAAPAKFASELWWGRRVRLPVHR